MTTYTITCPPTVGTFGSTGTTTHSITETLNTNETQLSASESSGNSATNQTLSNSAIFGTTHFSSIWGYAFSLQSLLEDAETRSVQITTLITKSWDGAATTSFSEFGTTTFYSADTGEPYTTSTLGQTLASTSLTSFSSTASQTTSTTRSTQLSSTVTGTLITNSTTGTTIVSASATVPRTAATQTSVVFSSAVSFSTTRATTTTRSHSVTRWRSNTEQSGDQGTWRIATVVMMDTSEAFYSLTKTVDGYEFVTDIASLSTGATEFTVFPTFETTEGMVFQTSSGEYDEELEQTTGTIGTESSVQTSSETYRAAQPVNTTITVATVGLLPPQTATRTILTVGTLSATTNYESTVYTGDTTEISTMRAGLISAQIGNVTYSEPALYFTTQQTTWPVAFTSSGTFSETGILEGQTSFTSEGGVGQSAAWQREISYYAAARPLINQNIFIGDSTGMRAVGASYQQARAPLSSVSQAALRVGAEGMTVSLPNLTFLTGLGARTAMAVLSTTWNYVSNSSTVRVSAGADGLSATSQAGTGTNTSTTTTSGSWTTQGDPVTVADVIPVRRINAGGRGATGGNLTVTQDANIYLTSNNSASGTTSFSSAFTSEKPLSEGRAAISNALLCATGRHAGEPFATPTSLFLPYFTTQRNMTSFPTDPVGAIL
jgi:hypothetical protein